MCNGNTVAAALISFFEGWHNYKLKQIREWRLAGAKGQPPNTWQHHTGQDLVKGIMGLGRRHSIDIAKDQLASMGVIIIGRNPDPKFAFDATLHYQFQPDIVATLLACVENSKSGPDVEIDTSGYAENDGSGYVENSAAIPKNTSNQSAKESISGGEPPVDKKPEPKTEKKKRAPGADADWQRWVDAWHEFFKKRHDGIEPMWNGANLASLKKLRVYLCKIATQVPGSSRDDCGFGAWSFILDHWDQLDQWQREQFDLGVVYQKISNILTQLKNGTNTNRGAHSGGNGSLGTSAARVQALNNY
jgi:hypothetical protein